MKRISKILLILLCLMAFKVDAFSVGDSFTWGVTQEYTGSTSYFKTGWVTYTGSIYHVAGDDYPIYCMDPSLATPYTLYVYRVLMDSDAYKAEDAGLIKAIEFNGQYGSTNNLADDFAKAITVRMLVNGVYGWTNSNANSTRIADINAAAKSIINLSSVQQNPENCRNVDFTNLDGLQLSAEIAEKVKKHFCDGYITYKNYSADTARPNVSGKVKKTITTETGTDYILEVKVENFDGDGEREIYLGPITGATKVYGYSYSFATDAQSSNYSENSYSTIQNSLSSDGKVNKTYNLLDNDEFAKYLNKGSGNAYLYIAFHVEGTTEDTDNCDSSIYLKYSYIHPDAVSGALLRADAGGMDTSDFQRFVIFAPSSDETINVDSCNKPCTTSKNLLPAVCEDGLTETSTDGSTTKVGKLDSNGNVVYSFREVYFSESDIDNVKACVLSNTDEAMNTYKYINTETASALTNNKFCSLYCKEDYVFNLPYQKTNVANGRYFQIDLDVAGQQTCYSTTLDQEYLNAIIVELEEEAVDAYNTYVFYDYLYNTEAEEDERFPTEKECTFDYGTCTHHDGCDAEGKNCKPYCTNDGTYTKKMSKDNKYYYYTVDFDDMTDYSFIQIDTQNKETGEFTVSYTRTYNYEETGSVKYNKTYNVAIFGGDPDECTTGSHTCNKSTDGTSCSAENVVSNKYEFSNGYNDWKEEKDSYKVLRDEAISRLQQILDDINSNVNEFNSCTGVAGIATYEGASTASQDWYASYNFNPKFTYSYNEPYGDDYKPEEKFINMATSLDATYNVMIGSNIEMYADYCPVLGDNAVCNNTGSIKTLNFEDGGLSDTTIAAKTYCIGEVDNEYKCTGTSVDQGSVNTASNLDIREVLNFTIDGDTVSLDKDNPKKYNVTKITNIRTDASVKGHYDTPRIFYTLSPTGEVTASKDAPIDNSGCYTDASTGEEICTGLSLPWSLVDGLPVGIKTPVGVYYYQILIDDLGTFYNTGKLGRIYGSSGNSISNLRGDNKLRDKNDANGENVVETLPANGYACTYQIGEGDGEGENYCVETANAYCKCSTSTYSDDTCDCRGHSESDRQTILAEIDCATPDCKNNISCCPGCTIACVGTCLFSSDDDSDRNGETLLEFRAINIAELNPNNRSLGYNWNSGDPDTGNYNWLSNSVTNVLVAQKAGITIDEIESRATIENIEDLDSASSSQLSSLNDYALSVTMTPAMITEIKKYNKDAESEGNYNNQTLECYDYILSYNTHDTCVNAGYSWIPDDVNKPTGAGECRIQKIMCYSSFITYLKETFGDLVDTTRPTTMSNINENESTTLIADYGSNAGGSENAYFKKMSSDFDNEVNSVSGVSVKNIQNYWAIFRYDSVDINNDGVPDIGPSWR